jgi:deazaflavin-dependent oxidoreductase (nitroreductase family)
VTGIRKRLFRAGLKGASGAHRALYLLSGGRIGGSIWGLPILLLTTRGRQSGKARTTPLCFMPDGRDLVVIASNGGMDWFPAWWLNLTADPHATVRVGRRRLTVVAREVSPAERERLWAAVTATAPGYLRYEARTQRSIPLGVLAPTGDA